MTADRLRQLAAEAGFEQIMKHKDGSTTVLPDALFERFAALVLQDNQAPAEAHGGVDCIGLALDLEARAKLVESQTTQRAMQAAAHGLRLLAAHPQPKGTDADDFAELNQTLLAECDRLRANLKSVWAKAEAAAERRGFKLVMQMPQEHVELVEATQAPAPAPELTDDELLRIWRKHYPQSVPGQLTVMAMRDVIAADRAASPSPAVAHQGGVDCIGLALDLEARAKTVESQTTERAMKAAAHGLRLLASSQTHAVAHGDGDANDMRSPTDHIDIAVALLETWARGDPAPLDRADARPVVIARLQSARAAIQASGIDAKP